MRGFVIERLLASWMLLLVVAGCATVGRTTDGYTNKNIDKNNRLTITLGEYNYGDRTVLAQSLQRRARSLLGDDVWVQRGERGLAVNYGHFANNKRAKKAFRKVKKNYKALRAGYLQFPYIKEIPRPNPAAPAQWDLLNNNCAFSFEIGTYFDLPEKNYYDRKQDAVNAVKKLRQEGETAFYVHGHTESRVYAGCFSHKDIVHKWERGRDAFIYSPVVRLFLQKYPYRYEHGAIVYHIRHDKGKKIRTPQRPMPVEVESIRREIVF